jgi:23S rRNA (uracil1939-C5)-methyltransferase
MRDNQPNPNTNLQPGQLVELDITDIAFGGDGIGRVDGFVVFVPFVIVGEKVEAKIVEVKRRFATADLVRVITPSPHRVEPKCAYYANCAGCQYQHIDYPHQLELKQKQIIDIFQRIGKISNAPVEPVVASPRPYYYRNKIVVHGPGRPGFWSQRGRSIIAIEQCPIAREEINERLAEVSRQILQDIHLTIRCNSEGQIWLYQELRGGQKKLADDESRPDEEEQAETDQPDESEMPAIPETLLGKTLHVPIGSFFQVNAGVISAALEHVRGIVQATGCRTIVDAYCGIGLFSLMLADVVDHCYGIEFDAKAIKVANDNAARLGLTNCDFYAGKTERLLFYTLRQCDLSKTCLILDPPRSGCAAPVLKNFKKQKPHKVIYVSCAPPMLARDLKALAELGYRLDRVTPFDMFPQTQHCEAVAELTYAGT